MKKKNMQQFRPKFEMVPTLDRELGGLGIGEWTNHIHNWILLIQWKVCKAIVAKAKEAGVVLTGSRRNLSIWKDPKDSISYCAKLPDS